MAKPQGFSKSSRLRSQKEITQVFRRGRYHRLGLLQAKTIPAAGERPRFMISVRKSVGSAPERNRLKRLVREAIRLNRDRLAYPYDVCIFMTAKPEARPRLETIVSEVLRLFDRIAKGHREHKGNG